MSQSKRIVEHKILQSEPGYFADYTKTFTNKREVEDISNTSKTIKELVTEE